MRKGLKTLYKKTKMFIKHPDLLFKEENPLFPDKGAPGWKINLRLYSLANELSSLNMGEKIGSFHCTPDPEAIKAWQKLLRFNPNNLGNWSLPKQENLDGTRKIERSLIKMMINLSGGQENEWEGYVTTGGTESNIYSVWIGRNYLKRKASDRICIMVNDLTHYSIVKAADICAIDIVRAPLNREKWIFDVEGLLATLKKARKNYDSFLIPLTLGYTQTGTNDEYEEITQKLGDLENKIGIKTFVFIDAALNGLVLPFTREDFVPLRNQKIQSLCLDFHKAGMTPLPCGVVLYRKHLRSLIEKPIGYLEENDSTLLGSRSGISAAASYFVISYYGRKGFEILTEIRRKQKNDFLCRVRRYFPQVEVINEDSGISIGLAVKKPLPKDFLEKYSLFAKKVSYNFVSSRENLYIYKAAFLSF